VAQKQNCKKKKKKFGEIGAIEKSLQAMVYADNSAKLQEMENVVTGRIEQLKDHRRRNAPQIAFFGIKLNKLNKQKING